MTDRRRRAALRLPLSASATHAGQWGSQLLLRERPSSSNPPPSPQGDDNPFAPPPEGQPDQPWQPREPERKGSQGGGQDGQGDKQDDPSSSSSSSPGSQWSPRQPGRQSGGFGGPGRQGGPEGPGGQGGGNGPGLRWDPTDPAQRRARYALLSGMWAFFFALFDLPEVALLLGALALYWGGSSLRSKPRRGQDAPAAATPASPPAATSSKPQTTAAVSGLVTAALALTIVATTFTVQLVYRDYYTCVQDSLTQSAQTSCNDLLPKPLRPIFGVKE